MLEVGSARGWFLEAARARAALPHGIEPERVNAEGAAAAGLSVERGFFPADLTDHGPFDVIVFNDVFEHLPDPVEAAVAVERLLRPGGMAVVNLPSSRGALFRLAGVLAMAGITGPLERMWQKGFASPHVSYFAPPNLRLLVERHTGMTFVEQFPLPAVSRSGLSARISGSHRGLLAGAMLAGVWLLSFGLRWAPLRH